MQRHWLDTVIDGVPSAEAIDRMCRAWRTWWAAAGSRSAPGVPRCAGLPDTAQATRLSVRDHYLLEALRMTDGPSMWARCVSLSAEVERFRGWQWPAWWHLDEPPAHASDLDATLWRAARAAAGNLPTTPRRLHQIAAEREALCADRFMG